MNLDIVNEILNIDNKAKNNIKEVEEKNKQVEKYIVQEVSVKEAALEAKYQDTLNKLKDQYEILAENKRIQLEEKTNLQIQEMEANFNSQKDSKSNEIVKSILNKVINNE